MAHFELQYTTRNWGITLLPGNGLNPCLARPHMRPRIPLVDHRTRHGNRPPLVSASTVAPDAVDVGTESLFLECWACAATGTRHRASPTSEQMLLPAKRCDLARGEFHALACDGQQRTFRLVRVYWRLATILITRPRRRHHATSRPHLANRSAILRIRWVHPNRSTGSTSKRHLTRSGANGSLPPTGRNLRPQVLRSGTTPEHNQQ